MIAATTRTRQYRMRRLTETRLMPRKKKDEPEVVWDAAVNAMEGGELRTNEFKAAYLDFAQHRREIKRPLTPTAIRRLILKLERYGHDGAIASIGRSIENGWIGVFDPPAEAGDRQRPGPSNPTRKRRKTAADRGEYAEDDTELPRL